MVAVTSYFYVSSIVFLVGAQLDEFLRENVPAASIHQPLDPALIHSTATLKSGPPAVASATARTQATSPDLHSHVHTHGGNRSEISRS